MVNEQGSLCKAESGIACDSKNGVIWPPGPLLVRISFIRSMDTMLGTIWTRNWVRVVAARSSRNAKPKATTTSCHHPFFFHPGLFSTSPCTKAMARNYTQKILLALIAFLSVVPAFVGAHLIEVVAGKKECFFEDLNKNDKVRPLFAGDWSVNNKMVLR